MMRGEKNIEAAHRVGVGRKRKAANKRRKCKKMLVASP
jgi:hypothetical protein